MNPSQAWVDAKIQINLEEEYTYSDIEVFDLSWLEVKDLISSLKTVDSNISEIERRILGGTGKHSFLNKSNKTQVLGKSVSPWWLLLDSQYTVNVFMKNKLVRDICDAHKSFLRVLFNSRTRTIIKEATLPGFGAVWFDNRCTMNILYLLKKIVHDSVEAKKFIMVMPNKEVILNESHDGINYYDL